MIGERKRIHHGDTECAEMRYDLSLRGGWDFYCGRALCELGS